MTTATADARMCSDLVAVINVVRCRSPSATLAQKSVVLGSLASRSLCSFGLFASDAAPSEGAGSRSFASAVAASDRLRTAMIWMRFSTP